mgnify:CR=1 FL=1
MNKILTFLKIKYYSVSLVTLMKTSRKDYIAGRPFPLKAIETYKCILTRVIKNGLYIAIKKEYTIDEFIRLLKILVTKEMQSILFTSSKYRHKKVLLQELYKFKTNIKVYGNRYERLV